MEIIKGPVGQIELIEVAAKTTTKNQVLVMCHPHPQFEGSMHNKVVTTVCKAFEILNFTTVRFNYRGVGKSSGSYGAGDGELEDTLAVIAWVRDKYPEAEIYLAGFSFGGYIAYRAANIAKVKELITLAPGITSFDVSSLPEPEMPWTVVQSDADEVIEPQAVLSWLIKHKAPFTLVKLSGVSHFFHGKLIDLRKILLRLFSNNY